MGRPPRISREQILEAAHSVFSARGFDSTTLAEIGGALGVTAAAILRHFPSKQLLFAEAMGGGAVDQPPPAVLELMHVPADADPRVVLRRFASEVVPFIQRLLATRLVVAMHENATRVTLPFKTDAPNPPRMALALLSGYFKRATEAGVMRVADPYAAAMLFIGHLQGYILFHHVLKVTPLLPLDKYIDALLDLWTGGAITVPSKTGGTPRGRKETKPGPKTDSARGVARRGGGSVGLSRGAAKAETARAGRKPGSPDGQRRVARRRPRDPRAGR